MPLEIQEPTIWIFETDDTGHLVDLNKLLFRLLDVDQDWTWVVFYFEGVCKDPLINPSSFCDRELSWLELLEFAESVSDCWNVLVVGFGAKSVPTLSDFQREPVNFKLLLERFDSSYWRISTPSSTLIPAISARFSDVRESPWN